MDLGGKAVWWLPRPHVDGVDNEQPVRAPIKRIASLEWYAQKDFTRKKTMAKMTSDDKGFLKWQWKSGKLQPRIEVSLDRTVLL